MLWGNKGFGKLLHIPRILEGYMHFQSCAHAQERPEKVLKLSPFADLESSYQEEVKAKVALSTT